MWYGLCSPPVSHPLHNLWTRRDLWPQVLLPDHLGQRIRNPRAYCAHQACAKEDIGLLDLPTWTKFVI